MPLTNNHLRYESARLKTFSKAPWPQGCPVTPQDLAKQGFKYIGPHDRVQCVFCHGILKGWSPGDTVQGEHRHYFPRCPFLRGRHVGNITLEEEQSGQVMPHHPDFQSNDARLRSLDNWPGTSTFDLNVFAEAGFFYPAKPGAGDSLYCFSCGGCLRNWEYDDDPWIEHAKWFPSCHFLEMSKGAQFISEICSQRNMHKSQGSLKEGTKELESVQRKMSGKLGLGEDIPPSCRSSSPRRSPQASATVIAESSSVGSEESQEPSDRMLCKICMDNEVEVTFVPCGHLVCCTDCAPQVHECPICRSRIRGTVRTYLA